jgi:hypothetical protein
MASSCSGACPVQLVISPLTRSGSRVRYDFVGLPGNFLSVRFGSSSNGPGGSTMSMRPGPSQTASSAPHVASSSVAVRYTKAACFRLP